MKKSYVFIFLSVLVVSVLAAYLSYPLVTGIVDKRRQEETYNRSETAPEIPEGELVIIMSADKATELINAAIESQGLQIRDVSVGFGENTVVLKGSASRDMLMPEELLKQYPNLWIIKQFIPEYADLGVSFVPRVEEGELKITPESLTLQEINLPLGFFPEELRVAFGDMIAGEYVPRGFELNSVLVEEGKITVAMD